MKNLIRRCVIAAAAGCAALASTSCYYDPTVYGSTGYVADAPSPPPRYSYGFGAGYGYGHPGFSTSFFVSTGDSRWGYDPYSYAYYDYVSHRYYDPYLCGYYPYGYRPRMIYGVPHVHGYRHGYAPPPRVINNHVIVGYRDRVGAYRQSGQVWGRNAGWDHGRANVIGSRPSRYDAPSRQVFGSRPSSQATIIQGNRAPSRNMTSPYGGKTNRYQQSPPRRYSSTPVTVPGTRNPYENSNPYGSRRSSVIRTQPRNRDNGMTGPGARSRMNPGYTAPQRQPQGNRSGNRGEVEHSQRGRRF